MLPLDTRQARIARRLLDSTADEDLEDLATAARSRGTAAEARALFAGS